MKHVIVAGGAGFISSHLCENLLKKGYAVIAIDNYLTGRPENLSLAKKTPGFHFIEADICNGFSGPKFEILKN
ncbi:MAG: NAD-dependent epimerase/dehydratase family protein, partial [Bdellovibrionota bacterium]